MFRTENNLPFSKKLLKLKRTKKPWTHKRTTQVNRQTTKSIKKCQYACTDGKKSM